MKQFKMIMGALALLFSSQMAVAQTFSSGSDGTDGALSITEAGDHYLDASLDSDGDHVFHFTTITIGTGVTLHITAAQINGPVYFLTTGDVDISGTIDMNGAYGLDDADTYNEGYRSPALPGAGGFAGGIGAMGTNPATEGSGPGGAAAPLTRGGGGGGHALVGGSVNGGEPYGDLFSIPLLGGSGGSGGGLHSTYAGGGGGAGGGAILIASSTTITVAGRIQAEGGRGGAMIYGSGGGGSGGTIRLAAPTINVPGRLYARGGGGGPAHSSTYTGGAGSVGRIRLESFTNNYSTVIYPAPNLGDPYATHLPTSPPPKLRVTAVDSVALPATPAGSFSVPDAVINNGTAVLFEIAAERVPVGTIVKLYLLSENAEDRIIDCGPLEGLLANSTATASAVIPAGFTRGYLRASWGE